jgi:hypothetical protein
VVKAAVSLCVSRQEHEAQNPSPSNAELKNGEVYLQSTIIYTLGKIIISGMVSSGLLRRVALVRTDV